MADIIYKGLSGKRVTLTVNTTDSLTTITNAAVADEGLPSGYYADWVLDTDHSITLGDNASDTYADLGLTSTSMLVAVLDDDPATYTKEQRQARKLEIATVKRTADSRPDTYDIDALPTVYSGNSVSDNPNYEGLLLGRPWDVTAVKYGTNLYRYTYTGYHGDDPTWFASQTPTSSTADSTLAVGSIPTTTSYQWLGYFLASTTETYTFYTTTDDGSYLWIGSNAISGFTTGNALVDNGGEKAAVEESGSIALVAGTYYPIRIQAGNNGGPGSHLTQFSTPTITKTATFTGYIFHDDDTLGI